MANDGSGRGLTEAEAEALRFLAGVVEAAPVPRAIVKVLRDMVFTPYISLDVTLEGHRMLRAYDCERADRSARRLIDGMSAAGRAALNRHG